MSADATARQVFIDALSTFLRARSPSIGMRGRLAKARADADKLLARADYEDAVLVAHSLR